MSGKTLAVVAAAGCVLSAAVHAENRTYDGYGNNLANPTWGNTNDMLFRMGDAVYADGIGEMLDWRPSAREISNTVSAQTAPLGNDRNISGMFWLWGQFIDHDFALTLEDESSTMSIAVPTGDPWFDPSSSGTATIDSHRSQYVGGIDSPRQYQNSITQFLDGSMVYGSDASRASALREFSGGRLATSAGGTMLPFNTSGQDNAGGPGANLFLAGDVRANEQGSLTAMHTVWVREHNRLADQIASGNPGMSDEDIYQQARKVVGAKIQKITYDEWLPAFLGDGALADYSGYDSSVDPRLSVEFTTAAFRFGHTMLNSELPMMDSDGSSLGSLSLAQAFFNPSLFDDSSMVDKVLGGLTAVQANAVDTQAVDEVRNMLFGPPGAGGLDLISLNLQRGRDHGIMDYNAIRVAMGLDAVTSFDQITSDTALAANLQSLYGSVDDIDAWIGLVAEDHLSDAAVGETLAAIFIDQFERMRDGDRFFYLNDPELEEWSDEIAEASLADIFNDNLDLPLFSGNIFFVQQVPAPGSLALLGVAGIAASTRRRRA